MQIECRYQNPEKNLLELNDSMFPISSKDRKLIFSLIQNAHQTRLPNNVVLHHTNIVTYSKLVTGYYGVIINNARKFIKSYIANCPVCNKNKDRFFKPILGTSLRIKLMQKSYNIMSCVAIDPIYFKHTEFYNKRRTVQAYFLIVADLIYGLIDYIYLPDLKHTTIVIGLHKLMMRYGPIYVLLHDCGSSLKIKPQEIEFNGSDKKDIKVIETKAKAQFLSLSEQ